MVDDQITFATNLGKLLSWMSGQGLRFVVAEVFRPPVTAWVNALPSGSLLKAILPSGKEIMYKDPVGGVGIVKSAHCDKRAADIFLIDKKGQPVWKVEAYKTAGLYWESLHERNAWGGHFSRADAVHFEMGHK